MRDDPTLRLLPVAVGGRADQRGVVATCNYVARKFGVHSAMAMSQALQRCPGLIVLRPSMEKYRIASRQILAIYRDYTDLVEPLSLDEAYLDVSNCTQHAGSATRIASEIRARIEATVGITASAGIAPNKFVAKIASDWNKPNGQFLVRPDEIDTFVAALPVKKLFGVGRVTAAKLNSLGAHTCADLRNWSPVELGRQFGKFGERLYQLCRGIDERSVNPHTERKSVSVEETYPIDLPDAAMCTVELDRLVVLLQARISRADAQAHIRKLFIKIRFADFRQTTVECLASSVDEAALYALLETGLQRHRQSVRLLGVGVRLREEVDVVERGQMGLFDCDGVSATATT
jgi:DNA polymerase-4